MKRTSAHSALREEGVGPKADNEFSCGQGGRGYKSCGRRTSLMDYSQGIPRWQWRSDIQGVSRFLTISRQLETLV